MTLQAALLGAAIDDLFATGLVLRRSIALADRVEVFFLDPLVVFGELLVSVDGRLFAPFDGGLFAAFVCGYVLGDVVCRYLLRDVDLRAPYGCREVGSTVEPKVPSAVSVGSDDSAWSYAVASESSPALATRASSTLSACASTRGGASTDAAIMASHPNQTGAANGPLGGLATSAIISAKASMLHRPFGPSIHSFSRARHLPIPSCSFPSASSDRSRRGPSQLSPPTPSGIISRSKESLEDSYPGRNEVMARSAPEGPSGRMHGGDRRG